MMLARMKGTSAEGLEESRMKIVGQAICSALRNYGHLRGQALSCTVVLDHLHLTSG